MEGGIERALVDLQDVLGNLLDALGDGPAVLGILLQRAEDQQNERAGQQIRCSRHGVDYRPYKVLMSTVNTKPALTSDEREGAEVQCSRLRTNRTAERTISCATSGGSVGRW